MDEKRKAELRGLCERALKEITFYSDGTAYVGASCLIAMHGVLAELLDEIERLQAVIARLENQLCSIKPGTYTASTR